MKRAIVSLIAALAFSAPAFAQDAGQIDKVRNGAKACIGCNLFQADLEGLELPGRDFENARLRQASLGWSTLDKTNLSGANLSVADMFGARLQDARLKGADLTDATLVGAWLGGADMTDAKLQGTLLSGAYLKTAKGLTRAQLAGAYCDETTVLPDGITLDACRAN